LGREKSYPHARVTGQGTFLVFFNSFLLHGAAGDIAVALGNITLVGSEATEKTRGKELSKGYCPHQANEKGGSLFSVNDFRVNLWEIKI